MKNLRQSITLGVISISGSRLKANYIQDILLKVENIENWENQNVVLWGSLEISKM